MRHACALGGGGSGGGGGGGGADGGHVRITGGGTFSFACVGGVAGTVALESWTAPYLSWPRSLSAGSAVLAMRAPPPPAVTLTDVSDTRNRGYANILWPHRLERENPS